MGTETELQWTSLNMFEQVWKSLDQDLLDWCTVILPWKLQPVLRKGRFFACFFKPGHMLMVIFGVLSRPVQFSCISFIFQTNLNLKEFNETLCHFKNMHIKRGWYMLLLDRIQNCFQQLPSSSWRRIFSRIAKLQQ